VLKLEEEYQVYPDLGGRDHQVFLRQIRTMRPDSLLPGIER
jgi:hypothetical protein